MTCILCHSNSADIVSTTDRHGKPLQTIVCNGCGQVFNNPVPSDDELAKFYAEDYRKEYKGSFKPRGRQIIRNFRRVRQHIGRFPDIFADVETVLDVGAGSGEFVFAMEHMAWKARGIEPNKEYAAYCRNDLEIDVATAGILDADFTAGSFDFINLSHVLEHLNDPVRYLSLLRRWMKDGGVLYVEVPNIFSYTKSKSKGNLFHYGHIFNFSPWTLRAAGRLAGLEECVETADRCADTTGVFFRKSDTPFSTSGVRNEANANAVKQAVIAHGQYGASAAPRTRFVSKNLTRIEESFASLRLGTSKKIGAFVLHDLAAG